MKTPYALYIALLAFSLWFFTSTNQTFAAAANCSPLYNGGVTKQQYCFNPTPTPNSETGTLPHSQITPLVGNQPQQTKGGQKIYPPSKTKTTPSTGPEDWAFPVLFLIGGIGFWLRNKAKNISQL